MARKRDHVDADADADADSESRHERSATSRAEALAMRGTRAIGEIPTDRGPAT